MELNKIKETLQTPVGKICIAVVIVLILILLIMKRNDSILQEGLSGIWEGAEDFCKASEISSMTVLIGKPHGVFSNCRECYIIISPNMAAQSFSVKHSTPSGSLRSTHKLSAKMKFEEDQLMPEDMTWEYNYAEGKLIFKADDIYAVLFKSPELTYMAKKHDEDDSSSSDELDTKPADSD
jgi:hypothetical protein